MKTWRNLLEVIPNEGPDVWYDQAFMEVIEQHIPIIKKERSTAMAIDPAKVVQFRSDFFGFLKNTGVAPQYWFATLRASGMYSPVEFDVHITMLILPDTQYLEQLRRQYQTLLRV